MVHRLLNGSPVVETKKLCHGLQAMGHEMFKKEFTVTSSMTLRSLKVEVTVCSIFYYVSLKYVVVCYHHESWKLTKVAELTNGNISNCNLKCIKLVISSYEFSVDCPAVMKDI